MTAVLRGPSPQAASHAPFRYGAVFLVVLTLAVVEIMAPASDLARALDVALAGAALTVAVATSRARSSVRRTRGLVVAGAALFTFVGVATGLLSAGFAFAATTLLIALVPVALIGGLLRLTREVGVTFQVVAGALTIYLTSGLLFASVVALISQLQSGPYFAQTRSASAGDDVYYSFTVLTTTGLGDYTPATRLGRALAVLEMLTGQLYLVTVIGVVVGNFAGRRARRETE